MLTFLFCLLLQIPSLSQTTQRSNANDTSARVKKFESTTLTVGTKQPAESKPSARTTTDSASGPPEKSAEPKPLDVWIMLMVVVGCGLLGGAWNYLRTYDTVKADAITAGADLNERLNRHLQICLLGGIVAGGIVPFVLMSASSDLLEKPSTYHYFVFGAYCLAAAVSSAAFIEAAAGSLVDRLKTQLKQNQKTLIAERLRNEHLQDKANKLETIANDLHNLQAFPPPEGIGSAAHKYRLQTLKQELDSVK